MAFVRSSAPVGRYVVGVAPSANPDEIYATAAASAMERHFESLYGPLEDSGGVTRLRSAAVEGHTSPAALTASPTSGLTPSLPAQQQQPQLRRYRDQGGIAVVTDRITSSSSGSSRIAHSNSGSKDPDGDSSAVAAMPPLPFGGGGGAGRWGAASAPAADTNWADRPPRQVVRFGPPSSGALGNDDALAQQQRSTAGCDAPAVITAVPSLGALKSPGPQQAASVAPQAAVGTVGDEERRGGGGSRSSAPPPHVLVLHLNVDLWGSAVPPSPGSQQQGATAGHPSPSGAPPMSAVLSGAVKEDQQAFANALCRDLERVVLSVLGSFVSTNARTAAAEGSAKRVRITFDRFGRHSLHPRCRELLTASFRVNGLLRPYDPVGSSGEAFLHDVGYHVVRTILNSKASSESSRLALCAEGNKAFHDCLAVYCYSPAFYRPPSAFALGRETAATQRMASSRHLRRAEQLGDPWWVLFDGCDLDVQ